MKPSVISQDTPWSEIHTLLLPAYGETWLMVAIVMLFVVTLGGVVGTVHELGLFGTSIITPDNVLTIVGNGQIFSGVIQNYSSLPFRRVERTAQLAVGVDPIEAIERLKAAIAKIPNVSTEMPPEINLLDIRLEGPVISVRPYTHTDNYWQVYFDTNEAIVRVCKEAGWPAPYALHQIKQVP